MLTKDVLAEHLAREFTPSQAALLAEVIIAAYADLVKTSDFNELKEIVRDLAKAQQRTEQQVRGLAAAQQRTEERLEELAAAQQRTEERLEELAAAQQRTEEQLAQLTTRVDSLAAAQQRTEERLEELAAAQQRTEEQLAQLTTRVDSLAAAQQRTEEQLAQLTARVDSLAMRMDELAEAQRRTEEAVQALALGLRRTRSELAGLGRQFGYALENEAYRALPPLLRDRYRIELTRRFIRTYIGDHEINLLAEGRQNGEPVLLVGEVKSQLGTRDFEQLRRSVEVVRQAQAAGELPNYRIVPLFVAHVARPPALKRAEAEGIIVVQSFEW